MYVGDEIEVSAGDAIIRYTVDGGAEQTAQGVIVEQNGIKCLVDNAVDQSGIILVADANGVDKGSIMFMGYFNINMDDGMSIGNESAFAVMFNGTYKGSSSVITIKAIEKVEASGETSEVLAHFDKNSELFDASESSPMYYVNLDSNPIPAVDDGAEYVMRFAMNGEEFTVDNLYVKSVLEQPLISDTAVFMLSQYVGGDYPYVFYINLNSNMLGSTTISGLTIQPWIILGYHHIPGSDHEFAEGGACILASKYLDEGDIFESFEIISIEKKA